MKDIADLIARIIIALMFFFEALDSLVFFKQTKETLTAYGIDWGQDLIMVGSIGILLLGATLVLIGYYANIGALLLLLYWIPFTFIVYSFWNDPPELMRIHAMYFVRNLALAAGLLILFANGAGKYSISRIFHVMRLPD